MSSGLAQPLEGAEAGSMDTPIVAGFLACKGRQVKGTDMKIQRGQDLIVVLDAMRAPVRRQ